MKRTPNLGSIKKFTATAGAEALINRATEGRYSSGAEALIKRNEIERELSTRTNRKTVLKSKVKATGYQKRVTFQGEKQKYGAYKNQQGQLVSTRHILNALKALETVTGRSWSDSSSLYNKFLRLKADKQALFIIEFNNRFPEFQWDAMFDQYPSGSAEALNEWEQVYQEVLGIWREVRREDL